MDYVSRVTPSAPNGMTPPQIASYLVMDTRTVKKLLAMSEQEYLDFEQQLSTRTKNLNPMRAMSRIGWNYALQPPLRRYMTG